MLIYLYGHGLDVLVVVMGRSWYLLDGLIDRAEMMVLRFVLVGTMLPLFY